MSISVECACGKRLKVKDEFAGKKIRCPGCDAVLRVPAADDPDEEWAEALEQSADEDEEDAAPRPTRARSQRGATSQKTARRKSGGKSKTLWIVLGCLGGGMFLMCLICAGLLAPAIHAAREAAQRSAAAKNVPAPQLPERAVFRPAFVTTVGEFSAGTAFVVRAPQSGQTLIITAYHLFGEAGGLPQQVPAAQLPQFVQRVSLEDCWRPGEVVATGGPAVSIPQAAPLGEPSPVGDVAAFVLLDASGVHVFELATAPPQPGDPVWLAAESLNRPGVRLHRASFSASDAQTCQYVFDDQLELRATSGAPVLNAQGQVVAINLGGGQLMKVFGIGNPVRNFIGSLR